MSILVIADLQVAVTYMIKVAESASLLMKEKSVQADTKAIKLFFPRLKIIKNGTPDTFSPKTEFPV